MRFDLSEDQALLQSSTRDFFAKEFPLEKTRRVMEHEARGFEMPAWRQIAEMGYPGLLVPESAGGQGLGPIELAIVCEEAGRSCLPGPLFDVQLAAATLAAAGKQDALLRAICAGEKIVTIAWRNSPYAGEAKHTTHFAHGRVKGHKYFVPFASSADALLVTTAEGLAALRLGHEQARVAHLGDLSPRRHLEPARFVLHHATGLLERKLLREEIARRGLEEGLIFGEVELHQRGSCGRPSTRLAMMLRWISDEPE